MARQWFKEVYDPTTSTWSIEGRYIDEKGKVQTAVVVETYISTQREAQRRIKKRTKYHRKLIRR